jgi:hypothetical protein
MNWRRALLLIAIAACTGALAFAGEGGARQRGEGGQRRSRRQRPTGRDRMRMPSVSGVNRGASVRPSLAKRLMDRFPEGEVPEELKQWDAETRLIQLRLRILERKMEKKEEDLLESKELASLLAAYDKVCADYHTAMEKHEDVKKRREQIAEIDKSLDQLRSVPSGGQDRRQRYMDIVAQVTKRRKLEEEIASIVEKDEVIKGLSVLRMKAAEAIMDGYDAAKEKDTAFAALEKDKKQLEDALQEVERAVGRYAREKGLMGGGQRGRTRTPSQSGGEKKAPAAGGEKKDGKASETSF